MMSSQAVQLRSRLPRMAGVAVERARLTVVPRRRTRAARMPFVMLVSLVLLGGVVGLLLFNTSMQQASFAATALEQQAGALTAREQTLAMELEVLRDPQRVAEQAQQMGMVPVAAPAFLRVSDGRVLGEPTPAAPADALRIQPRPPAKPAVLNPEPIIERVVVDTRAPSAANGDEGGSNGERSTRPDRSARR